MGSCAAPSAKGDDKFITTDYLQQCPTLCPISIPAFMASLYRGR
ncbi:replication initiator protein [Escherichia coli]|nr:replication initiator protein [Escherichia coli]